MLDKIVFRVGILAALRSKCTRGNHCTLYYINIVDNKTSYYCSVCGNILSEWEKLANESNMPIFMHQLFHFRTSFSYVCNSFTN